MICNHSKSNAKSLDSRRIDINSQLGSIIQIGPYGKHCAMKDMLELELVPIFDIGVIRATGQKWKKRKHDKI